MKKYSFVIWLVVLALVFVGGYYFLENYGKETPSAPPVAGSGDIETPTDAPNTPTDTSETPIDLPETPVTGEETDTVSRLKVSTPYTREFTVKNGSGAPVSLSDYKGKKVILNFWASWCPPCVFEMPEFQSLHNALDPEETVILAVNLTDGQRETQAIAEAFLKENDLSLNVLFDTDGSSVNAFRISSIPQTFIIDEEGLVQYAIMGNTDEATLTAILERME